MRPPQSKLAKDGTTFVKKIKTATTMLVVTAQFIATQATGGIPRKTTLYPILENVVAIGACVQ